MSLEKDNFDKKNIECDDKNGECKQEEPIKPKPWEDFNTFLDKEAKQMFQERGIVHTPLEENTEIKANDFYKQVTASADQLARCNEIGTYLYSGILQERLEYWKTQHYSDHTLELKKITSEYLDKQCTKGYYSCQAKFNDQDEYFINCKTCEDAKSFHGICRYCNFHERDETNQLSNITDDPLQMLPFSKLPFERFNGEKEEKWVCGSSYMKGNNLPEEFCQCLLGLTVDMTQEEYDRRRYRNLHYIKARDSELRICGPCYNFWKKFDFDAETDYTKLTLPNPNLKENQDEDEEENPKEKSKENALALFKKPPLPQGQLEPVATKNKNKIKPFLKFQTLNSNPTLSGSQLYKLITESFIKKTLTQTNVLTKTQFTLHGFIINKEKHLRQFPANIQQNFDLITNTQLQGFTTTQLSKIEFNNQRRIVVGALEEVSIKGSSAKRYAKTLRILNPDQNYKEDDCILLETSHVVQQKKVPSYIQYNKYLIYMKRIFTTNPRKTMGFKLQKKVVDPPKEEEQKAPEANGEAQPPAEEQKAAEANGDAQPAENENQANADGQQAAELPQPPGEDKEVYSYLQLCMYNIETKEEKYFRGYAIPEVLGFYSVIFNTPLSGTFIIFSYDETIRGKIFGSKEAAINEIIQASKEDTSVRAIVMDMSKMEEVYLFKASKGEFGTDSDYQLIYQYYLDYVWDSNQGITTELSEPVTDTENTFKDYEVSYYLQSCRLLKMNYFVLFKDADIEEPIPESWMEEPVKCTVGYSCSQPDANYNYYKWDWRKCDHCSTYTKVWRCDGCNTWKCDKHLLLYSGKYEEIVQLVPDANQRTLQNFNFIYRMDRPSQPVKYYNNSRAPLMFYKSVEAVKGGFSDMHAYPNIKMKEKAEFKLKPKSKMEQEIEENKKKNEKEPGDQDKQTQLTQVEEAMQRQYQDSETTNYRNMLLIKEASFSSVITFHYDNEEITPNPYERKRNQWLEHEKKIQESLNQQNEAGTTDPNMKAVKADSESQPALTFTELPEYEVDKIEMNHQGIVREQYYTPYMNECTAEIWGATIKNVKLPYQDDTCSYTQFFFQSINGIVELLYPLKSFSDNVSLKAGDGDCTTTKSYLNYLQEKAVKQTDDFTIRQALQARSNIIQEKLQNDLKIKVNPSTFDFLEGSLHQDLIWTTSNERFQVHILQMNLQNEILDGKFYKQPQVGVKIDDSFEQLAPEEKFDLNPPDSSKVKYFNTKYRNLIYTNSQVRYPTKDEQGNILDYQSPYEYNSGESETKVYIEGQNGGKLIAIDIKDKESDKQEAFKKILTPTVVFMARTKKGSIWFVLKLDDYYMLVRKQLNDFSMQQNGILKSDTEIYVFKNNKNKQVDLIYFKDVMTFLKSDKLEEYKGNVFFTEQYVDNRFEYKTLVMVYVNNRYGKKECLSVLVVDLETFEDQQDSSFNIPTHILKMQVKSKLNETINLEMNDILIQRFSEEYAAKEKGNKVNYVLLILEKSKAHQQHLYEMELNRFSHEDKWCFNFNIRRKSLSIYSPNLASKYYYIRNWNSIVPLFDKPQMKFEGYYVYNESYSTGQLSHIIYEGPKKHQHMYDTEIMSLDCRKLTKKEFHPSEYILYLDAKFKKRMRENYEFQFDPYDEKHLLDHALYSMFNMVQFDYMDYLTSSPVPYNIFKKREELFGNTISDLFVKDPKFISEALEYQQKNKFDKTIAESMYEGASKEDLVYLNELGHFKGDSVYFLQCDFSHENLLMRAANEKAFKTASLIIEHIFNLSEGRPIYQVEFMKALPVILSIDKIAKKMIQFFNLPDENNKMNQLSFEQLITDEEAPLFATVQWDVIEAQAQDYNNLEKELVSYLLDAADSRTKEHNDYIQEIGEKISEEERTQTQYSVKNTYVDFRAMICSQKFQQFKNKGTYEVRFDNYFLSTMVEEMSNNINFLSCESVNRMINHHFSKSQMQLNIQGGMFLLCYYLPFIVTLFNVGEGRSVTLNVLMMTLSLLTLLVFLGIEIIQIKMNTLEEYVNGSGIWNFFDITQIVTYLTFYFWNAIDGFDGLNEDGNKHQILTILECYLIVTGFVKVLFFLRLYQSFGNLVMMVQSIFTSVGPFLIFFVLWVNFFALLYMNLGISTEDDENYVGVNSFVKYIFTAYRCSIGDIQLPSYTGKWAPEKDKDGNLKDGEIKYAMVTAIWIVWMINQFMNLIVLLNFLIAIVSAVHEQATADQASILAQNKASLNREFYEIQKFFKYCKPYGVLMFQIEVKEQDDEEVNIEFYNLGQTIQNFILKQNEVQNSQIQVVNDNIQETSNNLAVKLDSLKQYQTTHQKEVEDLKKDNAELKKEIDKVYKELKKIPELIEDLSKKQANQGTSGKPWKDLSYQKVNLLEQMDQ